MFLLSAEQKFLCLWFSFFWSVRFVVVVAFTVAGHSDRKHKHNTTKASRWTRHTFISEPYGEFHCDKREVYL